MIDWLRRRLENNSNAVFARAELEDALGADFQLAVESGLLRPLPVERDGIYVDRRSGRVYSLVERDGRVLGWNDDQPDEMPIELSAAEIACYQVDVALFTERFGAAEPASQMPLSDLPRRERDLQIATYWREEWTLPMLANRFSLAQKSVQNILTTLRKTHGDEIAPLRRPRRP